MQAEWPIVFATFAGPIFAVSAGVWLERHRATMQAKYDLFLILMRNRQLPLSVDYVGYLHVVQAIYAKNKLAKTRHTAIRLDQINEFQDYFYHHQPLGDIQC